ncbi:MAG: helix-turn-helix domain-containing protein [Mycobacterium sp.]|nr:helix-turn-helix domain-containing protein [Mycobacterium sp.]
MRTSPPPRREVDPEQTKRSMLRLAAHVADDPREHPSVIRAVYESGASVEEICEVSGLPAAAMKDMAMSLARRATERYHEVERTLQMAFCWAHDSGASLREIAEATGVPHMTVKRIIDREKAS